MSNLWNRPGDRGNVGLNYDSLLYGPFCQDKICYGYDGHLVDGVLNSGFDIENLQRKYDKTFNYYLHLHGSPLFINDEDQIIRKMSVNSLSEHDFQNGYGNHIVLTHVKHKPSIISSSQILMAYWRYLSFVLNEVEEVILFGYSGEDKHLNELLRVYKDKVKFRVIEWDGSGTKETRNSYWNETLKTQVRLVQLDSILNFNEW